MRCAIGLALWAIIYTSGMAWAQEAAQSPPFPKAAVYSVKFLCGFQSPTIFTPRAAEKGVKPGNYTTSVNIHNFHEFSVKFCKKAVTAPPERCFDGKDTDKECLFVKNTPIPFVLDPNGAVELDCTDIVSLLKVPPPFLPDFVKGFVEIAVRPDPRLPSVNPLSVTGVYTALGCVGPSPPDNASCPTLIGTGLEVEPQNSFQGELPRQCG